MVLAVIAVICLVSINRYRDYRRNIQLANIKSDIATVQEALNRYYHTAGCHLDGTFNDSLTPSLVSLGLNLPGRPPQIPLKGNAYSVEIVDTGQKTTEQMGMKPVYALKLSANFASSYSAKRMQWYQKALGAKAVEGNQLIWVWLPIGIKVSAMSEQFRQSENKWRRDLNNTDTASPSYCAH